MVMPGLTLLDDSSRLRLDPLFDSLTLSDPGLDPSPTGGVGTTSPTDAVTATDLTTLTAGGPAPTVPLTTPPPTPTPHTHGDSHYHPDLDSSMAWKGTLPSYNPALTALGLDSSTDSYAARMGADDDAAKTQYTKMFLNPGTRIEDESFARDAAPKYQAAYQNYVNARTPIMAVRDAEDRIARAKSNNDSVAVTRYEGVRDALIKGTSGYDKLRDNYDTAAENWGKVRDAAGGYSKGRADSVQPFAEAVDVPLTDAQRGALRTARGGSRPGAGPDDADKSWVDKMNDGLTKTYATADNLFAKPMTTLAGIGTAFQGLQKLFDPLGETPAERIKRKGGEVKAIADAVAEDVKTSIANMRANSKEQRNKENYAFKPGERTKPSDSAKGLLARGEGSTTIGKMLERNSKFDPNPQQAAGQPAPLNPRDRRDKADEERERRYGRQNMV